MTVDLKLSLENKFNIDTNQNKFPNKIANHIDIRNWLNLKFILILYFLIKSKNYVNRFCRRLTKNKVTISATISSFFTVWLFSLNSVLIIICYPGILNPGPVLSGAFMNVCTI